MKVPKLELITETLSIQPLQRQDAAALAAITDDVACAQVEFLPQHFGEDEARKLIADMDDRNQFHAVRRRADDALIGVIGLHADPAMRLEIGYWFAADVRGRGVAFAAVERVVQQLVARCPGARIEAECAPQNVKSWALLRRLSFDPVGVDGKRAGRRLLRFHAAARQRIDVC